MPLPIVASFKYSVTVERFRTRQRFPQWDDEVMVPNLSGAGAAWKKVTVNDSDGRSFSYGTDTTRFRFAAEGSDWWWAETDKNGVWAEDGILRDEGGINALNETTIDLPVALLTYLQGSRSARGLYRIGEAKFRFSGDNVERVE